MPNLNLPQSYAASSSYGATSSRVGLPELNPSEQSAQQGTGLKTPSPTPTEQNISPPLPNGLPEGPSTEEPDYSNQHHTISSYHQIAEPYSATMNQQPQYMDSHQSYSSAGQSYANQPTTSQYPQYPHQPAVLHPGPATYAPSPTYGQQYGYSNGVTSPVGHPVPPSMGSQMNPGMLPLPGKRIHNTCCSLQLNRCSNATRRTPTSRIRWCPWSRARVSTTNERHDRPGCSPRHETSGDSNIMGR